MTSHGTPAVTTASPLMDGGSDVWQGVSQNNPQLQSEHRSKPNKRCFIFHQGSNCVILRLRIRKHFYTFSSDTLHQSGHEVKGLEAHKNKEYSPSSIFFQTNQYDAKNASSVLIICSMISEWNDAMCTHVCGLSCFRHPWWRSRVGRSRSRGRYTHMPIWEV